MKIIINPDTEYAESVKKKLKENGGYCPCKLVKNEDTKCMCLEFREQINNEIPGFCHCGLYYGMERLEDQVVAPMQNGGLC